MTGGAWEAAVGGGPRYRADVDGLRAIAILSVVLYHAHEAWLPGGYTGVDIFFVISGYLITRLIATEIEQRRFSIATFYVRRTKRILPALFLVLATTLLLGFFVLTPIELSELGRTVAATAGFVANMVFWKDSGYFDAAAESKPLLHTWSLAVEEQFYLLWPLTLLLLVRTGASLRAVVGGLALLSFAASCYAAIEHPPSAFFLLPSRAWELFAGAALALNIVPAPAGARGRHLSAVAGLLLICAGFALLDESSVFPGWNALLPCAGTLLLIAAGERGSNVVARGLLTRAPVVFIGLISYSLYLWHWPLLVLARIAKREPLSVREAIGIIVAAAVLAAITWRLVERPLRARGITPAAAPVLQRYALASVAILIVGVYTHQANGFLEFAPPELVRAELARYDGNPLSPACLRWQSATGPLPGASCVAGTERVGRLVLWGDSHADAVAPGIVQYAAGRGYATYQLTMAACPPLTNVQVEGPGIDYGPCTAFNRQVLAHIVQQPEVKAVLLAARWTLYTENTRFGLEDPGPITYLVDSDGRRSTETSKRAFTNALDATIATIREAGKSVIVLGTIPPLGINVPGCLARNAMPFARAQDCSLDTGLVLDHVKFADQAIERATANRPGVCAYLPKQALCREGKCRYTEGPDILYANDDHVSSRGALFLSQFFNFDACLSQAPDRRVARLRGVL